MQLKEMLAQQLKLDGVDNSQLFALLGVPPKAELGDFSLPCFSLAKTLRKSPNEIAAELVAGVQGNSLIEKAEVLNGYANFFLNKALTADIFAKVFPNLADFGKTQDGKGKLACIEFSSINVAKNPHVGHLSNTVFGESFCRMHENFGFTVKRLNYLGDYGTQFGKMITGFEKWGNRQDVEACGVDALQDLYIKVNAECEKDENLLAECRNKFSLLEQGDQRVKELYDWFVKISIDEVKKIYKILGIEFDDWRGEAFYAQFNQEILDELRAKKLVKKDNGALLVDLEEYNLGIALVQQSSGASLYLTRDLSALTHRFAEYGFDKLVYVTAFQQRQHFAQLFKIAQLLGRDFLDRVKHVMYGMISLPEGKISSRKGAVALIKDLFALSTEEAKRVLTEKSTETSDLDRLSEQIGVGALVFSALRNTAIKDSVFDIKNAISFEGETGPYLQYTHARCCSIVSKAGLDLSKPDFTLLDGQSWAIAKLIASFPDVLKTSFEEYEPSHIARFAIELASEFNKFYNENRIITEDKETSTARVALTQTVGHILSRCLYLLVMSAPEKM